MSRFRQPEIPRHQMQMWSQKLDDGLPESHPVRMVDEILRSPAFAKTFADWELEYTRLEGRPPYHPRDLCALYIYGMMQRIRSSRSLQAACYDRLDVMWLMSGQTPHFTTIAAFVSKSADRLKDVFRDVMKVGVKAELIKLDHAAVDGTKIEADASPESVKQKQTIEEELAQVDEEISKIEEEWDRNEKQQSHLFDYDEVEESSSGDLQIVKERQKRLNKALKAMERRQNESVSKSSTNARASITDPDSREMPSKKGKRGPNYNAQIAVDAESGMIVAGDVNDQADDGGQLIPMLDQVESNCGGKPKNVSADSAYNTGPTLKKLEEREINGFMPDSGHRDIGSPDKVRAAQEFLSGDKKLLLDKIKDLPKGTNGKLHKALFEFDEATDTFRCPANKTLSFCKTVKDQLKDGIAYRRQYGGNVECRTCPLAEACCENPEKGRTVSRDQFEELRERHRQRMDTDEAREEYKKRGPTAESPFGLMRRGYGISRFLRRGFRGVRAEWQVILLALDFKILIKHWKQVRKVLYET